MSYHPAILAVRQHAHHLLSMVSPSPETPMATVASFKSDQVRKMLRVEISRDEMPNLIRSLDIMHPSEIMEHIYGKREGPPTIEGVSYYEVASLPDPGWRVINPMAIA